MKKFLLSLVMVAFTSAAFAQFSVHVKFVSPDEATAPWVWAWETGGANHSGGTWPGVELTAPDANGYYTFSFPAGVDVALTNIIFSNGDGIQTLDIPVAAEEWFNVDLVNTVDDGNGNMRATFTTGTSLATVSAAAGVSVVGNVVKVASASSVEIVNISGLAVQSSAVAGEFVSQPLSAGLYIVVVDGKATKVLVK